MKSLMHWIGKRVAIVGSIVLNLGFVAQATHAQEAALEDMFGKGVHAYYSGNTLQAFQFLNSAIDAGTHDSRAYYFRGLTYLRFGDEASARADFAKGADLEVTSPDRFYDVGKSLERTQGYARQLLESYRAGARIAATQAREKRRLQRYEAIRKAAPATAMPGTQPPAAAPAGATPPAGTPAAPGTPTAPADPFATPPEGGAATPTPPADPFATPQQ
ncbi:MAG TPA: hypothetical protein VG713_02715 [Pirellulales bacterium]|nr:hypothetical protein [Pirellulales bacterium]